MTLIHVTVSPQMYNELLNLQKKGIYSSFSELGREAIRRLIREKGGQAK